MSAVHLVLWIFPVPLQRLQRIALLPVPLHETQDTGFVRPDIRCPVPLQTGQIPTMRPLPVQSGQVSSLLPSSALRPQRR